MEPDRGTRATSGSCGPSKLLRYEHISDAGDGGLEPGSPEHITLQPGVKALSELGHHFFVGERRLCQLSGAASGSGPKAEEWPVASGKLSVAEKSVGLPGGR